LEVKSLNKPDETRTPPKTKVEVVKVGDSTIMRATFEPGWKWSEHIKPIAGTESCQVPHVNYVISGRMKVVMDDGTEKEMGPGDAADIPPGHNAWVIGNEPCVAIDFSGGDVYAKKASS
jgi:quercetin dioxygenase-like cupin family protein